MSYDKTAEDVATNLSNNMHIDQIVDQALANPNRRRLILAKPHRPESVRFFIGLTRLERLSHERHQLLHARKRTQLKPIAHS